MDGAAPAPAAPSLGLMKGVMLCNRPLAFDSIAVPAGPMGPFRTGVVKELVHPIGKDPHILEKQVRGRG